MLLIFPHGTHRLTARRIGKQMPANTIKATNGFAKTASIHSIKAPKVCHSGACQYKGKSCQYQF